jgi:hypothetical protein
MDNKTGLLGNISNAFGGRQGLLSAGLPMMFGGPQAQQQALMQGLQYGGTMQAENRKTQQAEAQKNKTLEYLQQSNPELAALMEAGMSGSEALGLAYKAQQPPKAEKPTSAIQNYNFAVDQGFDGSFVDWQTGQKRAGATNVNVNNASEVGTIPQGFELFTDPETGARSMRPVTGGPEDPTKFNEKKAANEAQKATVARQAIADIKGKLSQGGLLNMPEVGVVGSRLADMGLNQEAVDVKRKLETLQSVVSFDRLQQMREASPTGGALGAVSERELALLQSSMGALSNDMSEEELTKTLDFIDGVMSKFAAYPQGAQAMQPAATQNGMPDFSTMSDEELEAIVNGR